MDRIILDDCMHALNQAFLYYEKELDDVQLGFWKRWIMHQDAARFKRCLATHIERGKYAPRIADIKALMSELSDRSQTMYQPAKVEQKPNVADELTANAWRWYIRTFILPIGGVTNGRQPKDDEEREQWLTICIKQAMANNKDQYGALLPEHRVEIE